jgi:hypothetical protein
MKHFYYFILSLLLFTFSNQNIIAQQINKNTLDQVNKNFVVMEITTGTWCSACPGAANGADDMHENGHKVAIIENHGGDSYEYPGSTSRNSLYGNSSYPSTTFNGLNKQVGGGNAGSTNYPVYLSRYNTAIAVMSDFTLDLSATNPSGDDYDVIIDINEPGDYTNTNLVVHLVVTESHIPVNWMGMNEVNFVSRAMYPTKNGTSFTGGSDTINISFTADSSWDIYNCELIAFIQDKNTKEILQADLMSLAPSVGTNNAQVLEADFEITCYNIEPTVKVRNAGAADITSFTINYSINSGADTGTFNWTGDLNFNQVAFVTINDFSPNSINETNDIEFEITNVNGGTDDDSSNNILNTTFNKLPDAATTTVNVEVITDNHGNELTWRIRNSEDTVVAFGNGYGNSQTYTETLDLPANCYYITLTDNGDDGGCSVKLTDINDNTLYFIDGDYGNEDVHYFATNMWAGDTEVNFAEALIYPNPTNGVLMIENVEGLNYSIVDTLGRVLLSKNNLSNIERISVSNFTDGTYFLKISNGKKIRTERVIISK